MTIGEAGWALSVLLQGANMTFAGLQIFSGLGGRRWRVAWGLALWVYGLLAGANGWLLVLSRTAAWDCPLGNLSVGVALVPLGIALGLFGFNFTLYHIFRFPQEAVVPHTPAHIEIDMDGLVLAWDAEAEALLGYSAAEMLGQPFFYCIAPAERAAHHKDVDAWIKAQLAERRPLVRMARATLVHKNGDHFPTQIVTMPVLNGRTRFHKYIRRLQPD